MTPSCTSLSLLQILFFLESLNTCPLPHSILDELEQTASQSIKNEFLLIGTKQRLKFSDLTNLSLSNDIFPVSSSARNLGSYLV